MATATARKLTPSKALQDYPSESFLFSISSKDLEALVKKSIRFISKKPTNPILASVCFSVDKEASTVSATSFDLSMGGSFTTDCVACSSRTFAVPAKLLYDYIHLLSDELIYLDIVKGDQLKIVSSSGAGFIQCSDVEDFIYPQAPLEWEESFKVNPSVLCIAINSVAPSASCEEYRQVLTGVNLAEGRLGRLVLQATDGHKAATFEFRKEDFSLEPQGVKSGKTFSSSSLYAIAAILKGEKEKPEEVLIQLAPGYASFSWENNQICSRMVDGAFPDIGRILPKTHEYKVSVNRKAFVSGLNRLMVFAKTSAFHLIDIHFNPETKSFLLSSEGKGVGGSDQVVTCDYLDGSDKPSIKICFNITYLTSALGSLDSDNIFLFLGGKSTPVLLHDELERTTQLVMPIRQSE